MAVGSKLEQRKHGLYVGHDFPDRVGFCLCVHDGVEGAVGGAVLDTVGRGHHALVDGVLVVVRKALAEISFRDALLVFLWRRGLQVL